ncbi:MAG: GntR family transcriptional regulator [candidate division Zixibacteria bacterium]|nr:GntR family transcriptional regulator [candidate division Zixibacteria bacterium]
MDKRELQSRSAIPLFLQVKSALRRRIDSGIWPPGTRIPSLEEIADEFAVARTTARQAVTELEKEGLIWRKQGRGTFVTERAREMRWLSLVTSWEELLQFLEGTNFTTVVSEERAKLPFVPVTEGKPAGSYNYQRRVHNKDGVPFAVADVYLESSLYKSHQEFLKEHTIVSVFTKLPKSTVALAHQVLTVTTADLEIAHLLDISMEAPVVDIQRFVVGKDGTLLYFSDNVDRADHVKLEMKLVT